VLALLLRLSSAVSEGLKAYPVSGQVSVKVAVVSGYLVKIERVNARPYDCSLTASMRSMADSSAVRMFSRSDAMAIGSVKVSVMSAKVSVMSCGNSSRCL